MRSGDFPRLFSRNLTKWSSFDSSSLLYVQLSHLYMTTEKTLALTIQTFVGKVISLLFNTLYRFAGGGGVKMDLLCRI